MLIFAHLPNWLAGVVALFLNMPVASFTVIMQESRGMGSAVNYVSSRATNSRSTKKVF